MARSQEPQPRPELAPPAETTGKFYRAGYIALATSGLLLATAFGAVAQITAPGDDTPTADPPPSYVDDSGGTDGDPRQVPGQAVPGEGTVVVDGVAITGTSLPPSSSTAPTTITTTGEDGKKTTIVRTPTPTSTGNGSTTRNPGPQPTDDPPSDTTTPPTSDDSDTTTTPPTSSPTGSNSNEPTQSPSGNE